MITLFLRPLQPSLQEVGREGCHGQRWRGKGGGTVYKGEWLHTFIHEYIIHDNNDHKR